MILITRDFDSAKKMRTKLGKKNCFLEPLFEVKYLPIKIVDKGQVFVTTSRHARNYIPKNATYASIPEHGKNAEEILAYLQNNVAGKITYLRGDNITVNIAAVLPNANEVIVYNTIYKNSLSERLLRNISKIKIALFFSAKAAEKFCELAEKHKIKQELQHITCLCLSKKVAEAAKPVSWAKIVCADAANEKSLLEKLKTIYSIS